VAADLCANGTHFSELTGAYIQTMSAWFPAIPPQTLEIQKQPSHHCILTAHRQPFYTPLITAASFMTWRLH
jgi:hypothetical protein